MKKPLTTTVVLSLAATQLQALKAIPGRTIEEHVVKALTDFVEHPSRTSVRYWPGQPTPVKVKLPVSLLRTMQAMHSRISWSDTVSAYIGRNRRKPRPPAVEVHP